ncbi:zinc finger MYM-type protein 1-like [Pseudophryne corroboree]|uniref:zinc finger MYM-type protein 1-like n=1 Tax=Pseudophryne corroboree TaxID=495146 RepID=UPI0030818EA7
MLGCYKFVVQLVLQKKIVEMVNSVSKCLQSKQTHLENAAKLICNAIESLTLFRNHFEEAKITAINMSEKWNVEAKFASKRRIRVKKQFDELCEDERLNDAESSFKVNIFCGCLDIIVAQLSNRFRSLDATVKKFKAILPSTLMTATDDELYVDAEQLIQHFSKDFTGSFSGQLLKFRSCLKPSISKLSTVEDMAKLLIVDDSVLSSSFTEVCTAIILFLFITVTVATAERSFSKLKIIKNYLCSTMAQERLQGLAILSIENERAKNLKLDKVIDEFAERKARKMNFQS